MGLVAQSVAGHAGDAGGSVGLVAFAASGGSAGTGGVIDVTNRATITTGGGQSPALVAQSIGGGGGSGGFSAAIVSFGGRGFAGGDGGTVVVNNSGAIRTGVPHPGAVGDGPDPGCGDAGCSYGIFAQSIGGGGGHGGTDLGWFSLVGIASGASHGGGGGWSTDARLVGLGGEGPTFAIARDVNRLFGRVGVSLESRIDDGLTLRLGFDALLSGDQQAYSGSARLSAAF